MRNVAFGAVVALAIAGVAYFWFGNQGGKSSGEDAEVAVHSLVVELAVPLRKKIAKTDAGHAIGDNPKMVSVRLTLRFANKEALNKARGKIRWLRRAYTNTISTYLSNRAKTDDVEAAVRTRVAKTTDELFGAGVVATFDVEGQFDGPAAK